MKLIPRLLAILLAMSMPALAQTGAITGTVKDQSAAVLPGVAVKIVNTGTNAERTFVTDERGDYNIPLLPIGTYRVEAELPGFKTALAENIKLNVNDRLRIDLTLQVGEMSERLVVTEAAPLVQSETSSVGAVIDNQKVVELPLNGRQFESLSQLIPGSVSAAPGSSLAARGGFNAAGGRETWNNITLDGVDNMDPSVNNFTLRPIVDAIQEFKVQTNSYSAEFGRGGGAQVSVSTRAGTNEFHGAAWEFLRNDKLDARDFFNTGTAIKPPLRRNQYGGTVGGPVRRDRTFFFFAFEGIKRRQQFTSLQQVPTLAFRRGDFSSVARALTNPFVSGATFPGNQIPADLIHPISRRILDRGSYVEPTPGLTGTSNYRAVLPFPQDATQWNFRIDHRLSDSNTLFGRYGYTTDSLLTPCSGNSGTACIPGYGHTDVTGAHSLSLVDTHIFSSRLVNEFRAGFNRQTQPRVALRAFNENLSAQLGIPANTDPESYGHPNIQITGFAGIGDRGYQDRAGNTFQIVDNMSYTVRSHAMKFGFDARKVEFNAAPGTRESLTFDGRWTGSPFADFLLGLASQTSRDPTNGFRYLRVFTYNTFFQDDFKVSNRVTLNFGLRYEYNTPVVEKYDRFAMFNIETGRYQIANRDGAGRSMYRPDRNNFAPRVGFAFRPGGTPTAVLRGGYGIFYDQAQLGNNVINGAGRGFPFSKPETFRASADPRALTLANPFPSALQATTIYDAPSIDPGFRDAYIQQWNLGYQREFAANMVFEVSYVGNKGTRLTRTVDVNQAFPGATGTVQQRRPYPQQGTINVSQSSGNSTYHGLLGRLERRFSSGLSFLTSYTYGHVIDDSTGGNVAQDARNLAPDRGNADFDARQRLVASYVYELPFGRGRRFGSGMPGGLNVVLGGWQLAGITTFQSGRPVFVQLSGSNDNSRTGGGRDRPNVTGVDPVIENRTSRTVYLNRAAYSIPALNTFGNAPRNYFNGLGTNNTDFTLGKNFKAEAFEVQFRAEMFNAFNRPFLGQPVRNPDNAAFGTITSTLGTNRQVQFGLKVLF